MEEPMDISGQSVYSLLHEALQKIRSAWAAEYVTREYVTR